jgi:tRNA U34 5-methylaminomethyl-2-thiouridine-forming methyltransferase MnmC
MKREIITTSDGSHTVQVPEMNVTYHSHHGAIQESMHVFINAGLLYQADRLTGTQLCIFEMGFGTGLNAFLTALEAEKSNIEIHYTAVEQYPLSSEEAVALNYAENLGNKKLFEDLHLCEWNKNVSLRKHFILRKEHSSLLSYSPTESFDLIYYDAFAPAAQPELWTEAVFKKLVDMLLPGGILVTYCSKGDVRRAMMAAGFIIEKIPGPKGKREMVRAAHPDFPKGRPSAHNSSLK